MNYLIILVMLIGSLWADRIYQLDDIYSYDVIKYTANMDTRDTTTVEIFGVSEIYAKSKWNTDSLVFDLKDQLNVNSILLSIDGSPSTNVNFTRENDRILVTPSETILKDTEFYVIIDYNGFSPNGSYFGSSYTNSLHMGKFVLFTLSAPQGARYWMPCKDIPSDKAKIDFNITTWPHHRAFANGLLINTVSGDNYVTYQWSSEYQTATYLMAIAVTNYETFTIDYASEISGKSFPIECYVYPEIRDKAEFDFPKITEMIDCYERVYGEYPFSDEKYGMASFPWGGGMENQTCTHIGVGSITGTGSGWDLIAHELSHQWIGDLVTCATWDDVWLNEGGATFSEAVWNEYQFGEAGYNSTMNSFESGAKARSVPVWGFEDTYNRYVYDRGAWTHHMMKYYIDHICGDGVFFQAYRNYLQNTELSYGSAKTSDFIEKMEQFSEVNLTNFANEWIYNGVFPEYSHSFELENSDESAHLKISITQEVPDTLLFKTPIPYLIQFSDFTDTLVYVTMDEYYSEFNFDFNKRVHNNFSNTNFNFGNKILCDKTFIPGREIILESEISDVKVYPNPFNPNTTLSFTLKESGLTNLKIFNCNGQIVYNQEIKLNSGYNKIPFSADYLSSGVYRYKITNKKSSVFGKMVLVK
ncbi:MAG: T9SS type A sorting domain-containing protein [Candidatus Delongbacteria bacterium]|nr:T9SS type A sorting domain-containing protein [Candidatus Delongbacteria bacterium]MBN2835195.1 T9SS type A sorting domain-containing protein [Candidatus Delongbacteria bacterium]